MKFSFNITPKRELGYRMRVLSFSIFFLVVLVGGLALHASEELLEGADFSYGEYLSGECVTCHHKSGLDKGIPSITGLDPEGFIYLMNAYKDKELDNPVMQLVAGRLDSEQIASLALYFASLSDIQ